MRFTKKNVIKIVTAILILVAMSAMTVFASEDAAEYVPKMYGTFWSLVPPLVAIVRSGLDLVEERQNRKLSTAARKQLQGAFLFTVIPSLPTARD